MLKNVTWDISPFWLTIKLKCWLTRLYFLIFRSALCDVMSFTAHIFFDQAFEEHDVGDFNYNVNDFVKLLVKVIDTAATWGNSSYMRSIDRNWPVTFKPSIRIPHWSAWEYSICYALLCTWKSRSISKNSEQTGFYGEQDMFLRKFRKRSSPFENGHCNEHSISDEILMCRPIEIEGHGRLSLHLRFAQEMEEVMPWKCNLRAGCMVRQLSLFRTMLTGCLTCSIFIELCLWNFY